jgi:hypothetical protein
VAFLVGFALTLMGRSLVPTAGPPPEPTHRSGVHGPSQRPDALNVQLAPRQNPQPAPAPVAGGQAKQVPGDGLSYETVIPRPTVKGYYEPRVVPYPAGKPVYVSGYYRKDGTYVRPHFRSLPRR